MRRIIEQVQMVKIISPMVSDWCEHSIVLAQEEYTNEERAKQLYKEAEKIYEANKKEMGGYPIMQIEWETVREKII